MTSTTYRKYLLAVLMMLLAVNSVDGLALGLVLQEIKIDLRLTDTQLGFLSGIAFALFYAIMGIPIARWADRGNRVAIISLTTVLWSLMLASCGMVRSFAQLVLVRIGIAVGEAGCMPSAQSLIADYFTRAERPKAVSIFMLGSPLSVVIGYFAAGWLNELYGWRTMYLLLGIPGVALSLLAWRTLKEPRRAGQGLIGSEPGLSGPPARVDQPSLTEAGVALWRSSTFRQLLVGYAVLYFFGAGISQWQPAFFIRSYAMSTGELGTWLAIVYGLSGAIGTYVGGELATRSAPNNEGLQLKAVSIVSAGFGIVSTLIYLSHNKYLGFAITALTAAGLAAASGPLFATIQTVVPERMRAMSVAVLYLFANLIGTGLGPLVAGTLSDVLRPIVHDESLRFALLLLCPGYLWSAWHFWRASKTVSAELQASRDSTGRPTEPVNVSNTLLQAENYGQRYS